MTAAKTALIIGASRGLGLGLVELMLEAPMQPRQCRRQRMKDPG